MEKPTSLDSVPVADRHLCVDGEQSQSQTSHSNELSSGGAVRPEIGHEEYEYVTGFKLAIVIVSVTLVFFLVMLDLSIIATVS